MAAVAAAFALLPRAGARRVAALALLFGALYAALNPPFAASNELYHLARAYELSVGHARAHEEDGRSFCQVPLGWRSAAERFGTLPDQPHRRVVRAELRTALSARPDDDATYHVENPISARSPLAYAALVPGLWLARGLSLPPLWDVYLARASGLAAFCGLLYFALSLAGRLAWPLAALALSPALLTQAGAAAPDSLTLGLALGFVALIERCSGTDVPGARRLLLLGAVFVALVCCNPACLLFALALPLVTWPDDSRGPVRWGYALGSVLAAVCAAAAFAHLGTGRGPLATTELADAQLSWAASQPLGVLTTVGRSLFRDVDDYTLQFFVVREVLSGQMRFSGGAIATLQAELILLLALGSARGGAHKARWFALGLLTFVCFVLLQALLSSANVGPSRLQNVYGRLFFPVGPLLVAVLA
ncbi:MAG TPA: DUF2142 domain-containing protein, partial [Polyangiales bacterium]